MIKNNYLIPLLLLFSCSILFSQNDDEFIRIVGNSEFEFDFTEIKVQMNVTEIIPTRYNDSLSVSFEENFNALNTFLEELNLPENSLERIDYKIPKKGRALSKTYMLELYSLDDLERLMEYGNDGVSVSSVKFGYSGIDQSVEESLIMNAISDAKRKASRICKNLKMKLGKILSIEDTSSGCCKTIKDSKTKTTKIKYSVNVTFELK